MTIHAPLTSSSRSALEDLLATYTTQPSGTESAVAAPSAASSQPGGRCLAKRVPTIKLGIDAIRMTIRTAATKVMTGILADLATNAYTTLKADSGLSTTYQQFTSAISDPAAAAVMTQAIYQFAIPGKNPIPKETLLTSIQFLVELIKSKQYNAGRTETLFGELIVRGVTIATWNLDAPTGGSSAPSGGPNHCPVMHPDGSVALGCLLRYCNP